MKKHLINMAAFSLLIAAAGCSNESIERAGDQNVISFQNFLGKQTKASETTTVSLETTANSSLNGIPVVAYEDNASTDAWKTWSLYYDAAATPPAWTYGTPVLQPNFDLVYYAWYPKTTVAALKTGATGSAASFDYTVPAVALQEDLIAAYVPATSNAAIALQFKHLLSQVNFSLQNVKDVKITINSITISGINNTATYTLNTNAWGPTSATGTPSYAYDLIAATFTTDGTTGAGIVDLKTEDNRLMLMPQSFASNATACFTIDFTLQDVDGNYLVGTDLAGETAVAYLQGATTNAWAAGKRYVYLIDFTNYLADRYIKFTVAVDEWEDAITDAKPIAVEVAQANKASLEGAVASIAAYLTAGYDAVQITAKGALAADLNLDLSSVTIASGKKVVIYVGGLATYDITATGWTAAKGTGNAFVTLTKQ